MVIQLCAPVAGLAAGLASSAPPGGLVVVLPPSVPKAADPSASAPSAPSKEKKEASADSFKFKIKDVLEADLTSSSQWLIWALLAIFVVFAFLIVVAVKSVAAKPKAPWIVAALGVVAATLVAFLVVQRLGPRQAPEATTIDKLYELVVARQEPARAGAAANAVVLADDARQWAALQQELRDQHRDLMLRMAELSASNRGAGTAWSGAWKGAAMALLLLALVAAAYGAGAAGWFRPARRPGPAMEPLPLNAMFHLEDLLSQLRMSADKISRLLESDNKPRIEDPNAFLLALNSVRRQLEGGLGADAALARETPLAGTAYTLKDTTESYTFYKLNHSLGELDDVLFSRYEADLKEWKPKAMAALAKAQRELVSVCEPVDDTSAEAAAPVQP